MVGLSVDVSSRKRLVWELFGMRCGFGSSYGRSCDVMVRRVWFGIGLYVFYVE